MPFTIKKQVFWIRIKKVRQTKSVSLFLYGFGLFLSTGAINKLSIFKTLK